MLLASPFPAISLKKKMARLSAAPPLLLLFVLAVFFPPSTATSVCGLGSAVDFPTQCYFNNDPQGRYVCCDVMGCDGFEGDQLTPHCKNFGFVPPNFGVEETPCGDRCDVYSQLPNRCCNAEGTLGICCPGNCGASVPRSDGLPGTLATCGNPPPVTPSPPAPTPPVRTCDCPGAVGSVSPEEYCDLIDFDKPTNAFNECPFKKDGFQLDACFVSPQPPLYQQGSLYCCIDQPPYDQLCGDEESTCCLDHTKGGVYCVPTLKEILDVCAQKKTPSPTPPPTTPSPTTAPPTTPAPTYPPSTTPAPTTPPSTTPAPTTLPPTCNCPGAVGTIPPEEYCRLIDFNRPVGPTDCPYKKDGFQLDTCFVTPQPPQFQMGDMYCCIDQPPYDQLCGDGQSTCCLDHERGGEKH
ncbi:hypothetical protein KFL_008230020 [Klebsormidium nitens]|uniref:Uncharacterized protein n=1 Tax=Klebsormidium nitens TaxID=105231 RepID=A0A1Y1ISA2_KLENI|nr:hypothetical protein KFL_008230020 [Klebsormidium nitens]|eukprot:GAQ91636.1 hypothetical protein KFL_008230020 [Klebsormidium nitens]